MTDPTTKSAPARLPEYLGQGILDPESVELSPEQVSANYRVEGDILYRVTVKGQEVQVMEYFDGTAIATTTEQASLENTFFHHLATQLPYHSRRFERLLHRLEDDRNMVVRFAEAPRFFFFPAGYLFTLRQPIGGSNQSLFDQLAGSGKPASDPSLPELKSVRTGILLKLLTKGEVTVEAIRVADFGTELHRLADAVERLLQGGFVPREKEYQLAVLDSSQDAAGSMVIYLGDQARGFVTFAVVVAEGTRLDLAEVENDFSAASVQWLESLKKQ